MVALRKLSHIINSIQAGERYSLPAFLFSTLYDIAAAMDWVTAALAEGQTAQAALLATAEVVAG